MSTPVYFSKFIVTNQVFYKTKYTYALVNLKPIVPGHVLVVPLRPSAYTLSDLSFEESQDYFNTLQLIQRFISWFYKSDALNIAIQDGPEAGQSVPHLHAHIIPRYKFHNYGDQVYDKIETWGKENDINNWEKRRQEYLDIGGREGRKQLAKPDAQRVERTDEVMLEEAKELFEKLREFIDQSQDNKQWTL
ncbi:hypothetical protein TBLA_0C03440 [Henningerozyma blattae CBS 6284]|uniref:Bis(5'-adenosyl)-triphosphatase n=1 Tax=Henningerozyma blattae (strain ATCC 34711 / CBS 6284 / DSM 70876 / NBRC 10599 / NRRL Y-10934 / UCD 77-7) TaxID=1071380 RepID=I2H195_HENB6|nr:hypothetical protein TBLA_0C03440 [Tetrapisispora blattae CBS 6284]CCH60147.1 hypothetical protein TBLA_0C03440 [Tetrapisispora blattae CBS 6284]